MENSTESMEALLAQQKAYLDKLLAGDLSEHQEAWSNLVTEGQRILRQEPPKQFAQLLDILSAQSSNFLEYGESILRSSQAGEQIPLSEAVDSFKSYMQQQTTDALLRQWQVPEQFAALFKTHSFRDDLLLDNPFISGLKSLLETPVVGGQRETQEQIREAIKLTLEYQEALREYITHYNSINEQAAAKMLEQVSSPESKITSLQQLHDIWVEAYESAYAKTVFTDAYQRSHGRISNALMLLRKYIQDVRDVQFQSIGLATRKGLDTALSRQHQMRKELRTTKRELAALHEATAIISELRSEVEQLKAEVAALKQNKERN